MRKERSWIHQWADRMDLPGESFPGQPLLEVFGDHRVLIENHRGVVEYGNDKICVRVKYGQICVNGRQLRICRMCGQQLVIAGCIESINLLRGSEQ